MNKLRKIYKGEETWDCLYENKDQILKGTEGNKTYVEDGSIPTQPKDTNKNNIANIEKKMINVSINNSAAIDNDNLITEDDIYRFDVNEADYENFEYIEEEIDKKRINTQAFPDDIFDEGGKLNK